MVHQLDQLVVPIQVDGRTLKSLWIGYNTSKKHARASMENKVLLLMDNHKTHITAQSLESSEKMKLFFLHFLLTVVINCSH